MGYVFMYSDESLAALLPYIAVEPSDIKLSTSAMNTWWRKAEKQMISKCNLQ
jgi:hypothetical protein